MKAVFIAYNQAYNEEIVELLAAQGQRGFTRWENVEGKGDFNGFPRFGNHAWPEMNSCVITVVEDEKVEPLLEAVKKLDLRNEEVGVRAFVWNIEASV